MTPHQPQIYQMVFENMLDGCALHEIILGEHGLPVDYRFLAVNPAFQEMTGLSAERILGKTVREVMPDVEPFWIERYGRVAMTGESVQFEEFSAALDRHFKVSAFRSSPGNFVVVVVDITAQKAAAGKIQRLSRLYSALSQSNHAIVRCNNRAELLATICRVVVETGGMTMAWIGRAEGPEGRIRSEVAYGRGTEYLDGIEISQNPGDPSGRGPVGTSIRENRPVWCQDFQHDLSTAPWHERAARFGWRAAAALPLRLHGEAFGALTLYSDRIGTFDEENQSLLIEMAHDISYAFENFAREEEQQSLLKELTNLRTAVEQSASSVLITDPQGVIEYVNPAFETSTGYSAAEATGRTPRILKSGEQPASYYAQLWETIASGRTWRGYFHNKRKNGTLYWESATISPVMNDSGEIRHFIAVKEDITDRKTLEANLMEALDRAEAANRAKSEFLAVMSHELRTPLSGVLGFADLLAETLLDEEQRNYSNTIRASGAHLLQVVNDILDFSSLEKGKMRVKCGDVLVTELVESSCLANRKMAADKGLDFRHEIDPDVPVLITGDPLRLRQILINLLGNAVKFTTGGSVVLRVTRETIRDREFVDFSVEDTGPGIPEEKIADLFKPFTQGDSTLRRPFEGTGLGLAISQRLAKAMGGTIEAVSSPGKGSTFTLRIPLSPQPATEVRPRKRQRKSGALAAKGVNPPEPLRVLVVEDDRISSLLAGRLLSSLGHKVEFAANGEEALRAFAPEKFSVILMDMQMPSMDGIEATRRIRAHEGEPHVPIIALTANVLPGDRERCLAAGMDDFLSKPFTKDQLAAKLHAVASAS